MPRFLGSLGISSPHGRTPFCDVSWRSLVVGGIAVGAVYLVYKKYRGSHCKKSGQLVKKDWEKDVIYVCGPMLNTPQLPRLSPFRLKLETYLRLTKLNHESLDSGFGSESSKGQFPFIEYNGQEYPDSNLIINFLREDLRADLDEHLNSYDKGVSVAIQKMFEDTVRYVILAFTYWNFGKNKSVFRAIFDNSKCRFMRTIAPVAVPMMASSYKKKIGQFGQAQGCLKLTKEENIALFTQMLSAVSAILGDKEFLFGSAPSTADVYLFTYLSLALHSPPLHELRDVIRTPDGRFSNLERLVEMVRGRAWPDWDQQLLVLRA